MIHLVLRLGLFAVFVVGQNLVDIRFSEGELEGDAPNGSQVYFEAPLRADPNNVGQITVEIVEEAAKQAFGVFPTVLFPGDAFALILRDGSSIPLMDDINVFEVSLKSNYLDSDFSFDFQTFSLFVKILKPELEVPRILKSENFFKLNQRLTEGIVGKIDVKNLDKTDLEKFKYEIYGGFSKLFSIKTAKEGLFLLTTGCEPEICLNLPLNFTLMLQITPINEFSPVNQTEMALLHLEISKENILGPHFMEREYLASVVEKTDHFVQFVQLQAVDPDYWINQKEKINFALSEPSEIFKIDSESGMVKIKNSSLVTIENLGKTINLMVEVGDGKNPADIAVVKIEIIKAENTKESAEVEGFEFERSIYAFAVSPKEKTVGKVQLINENRGIIKIVEGGTGNFELDEKTGQIYYVGMVEKNTKNYTLKIVAFPDFFSSTIATTTAEILVAGIGTSSPNFEDDFVTILVDSNAKSETVIHRLFVEDLDKNAALIFFLENSICRNLLLIEIPCKNELVLHPNGEIVVKQLGSNLLTMTMNVSVVDKTHKLEDKDFVQILITIRRKKQKIEIEKIFNFFDNEDPLILSDDLPIGSYVYTAALKPLKTEIFKELKPKIKFFFVSNEKKFKIDENTGMIYTSKSLKNSGLQNLTFKAEINVEKNKQTKKFEIYGFVLVEIVKMEADPPKFKENKELKFSIEENLKPKSFIGKIEVLENDGGKINFEIIDSLGETQNLIKIDEDGKIFVDGQIDHEKISEMLFFVKITNEMEKSAMIPINITILNVNDNFPTFLDLNTTQFFVFENVPIGTFIGQNQAFDADDNTIVYSLNFSSKSPLNDKIFISKNGILKIKNSIAKLDGIFEFSIIANDGKHLTSKNSELVVMPTSKCQPIFDPDQPVIFEIFETSKIGKIFGNLKANFENNIDCPKMEYKIENLNDEKVEYFKIGNSGELELISLVEKLAKKRIPILISTNSGNFSTKQAAEIRILSTKVEKAYFPSKIIRIEVDENTNGTIIKVEAISTENIFYKLVDDYDGLFEIDAKTGAISVTRQLDRENTDFYRIKILAFLDKDFILEELSDQLIVNIFVIDLNDNIPKFEQEFYEIALDSTTIPGSIILTVLATDPDLSQTKSINYRIFSVIFKQNGRKDNFDDVFEVSEVSGDLKLVKSLQDFEGGCFEIEILASNDNVENVAKTQVKIWVADKSLHFIPILIHQNPIQLTSTHLKEFNKKLSTTLSNPTLLLSLRFYSVPTDGTAMTTMRDATLADFIAIDHKMNKVLPWLNLKKSIQELEIDGLSFFTGIPKTRESQNLTTSSSSFLLLICVFAALLLSIFTVFGIMICYYRKKFQREKQEIFEAKIAAATKPIRNWMPYPERYPELLREKSTTATTGSMTPERRSSYSVQEMKISVFS